MKFLIITPIGYCDVRSGGAEMHIFELMKQITLKTNIEVTVATSGRDLECMSPPEHGLRVEYLSKSPFIFPLPLLLHVRRYIKNADVVIENVSKFPLIIPAIISMISKRPFVAVVHHIHGRTLLMELPVVPALLLLLYEYVSLFIYALLKVPIVTVSKVSETELRKLGFRDIYVVHPAPAYLADDGNDALCRSRKPLLVYVGRVKRYKRLDHFVKAFKYVVEEMPDAVCLVVGKGDEKLGVELRKLASRLSIEKQVRIFVGNISNNLKLKILRKAWLYVFTSAKEGFSISAREALSQGVPIVAYDIPAMRELLVSCDSGVLARNGNVNSLAKQCMKALKNNGVLRATSSRARERAKAYNYETSSKRFLNAIKSVLKLVV